MADSKDNKSNVYAANVYSANPATALETVKAEAMGMDSLKDLENAIEEAAATKKAKVGKKTTRGAASLQKLDDEVVIVRVKTEQSQSARMLAVPGQPGYAGNNARLAIVPAPWRMYHGVPATWFVKNEYPDPCQQYSIDGVNDLANGVLVFGEYQAVTFSPFVEFKGIKSFCVGHLVILKPKFTAPLGQTAFTGTPAALKLVLASGGAKAVDWYLQQATIEIPVYVPLTPSPSGVSSALAVTFGANQLIGAMCMRDAGSAAAVRDGIFGILKQDYGYGEQTVLAVDGKETQMTTVSMVGACEILAQYDVKTAFCIWKKAPKDGEASVPVFYNTENMTGGVVGLMHNLAQQIALQMEKRSKPVAVKPVDEAADIEKAVMHEEMMKLVDKNAKLEAELAALKKTVAAGNNIGAAHSQLQKGFAELKSLATAQQQKLQRVANTRAVVHGSEEACKAAITAALSISNLVAAPKQAPLPAITPAKRTGVAGAAAATATGMDINNQS